MGRVTLVNDTLDLLVFEDRDSRLAITQESQAKDGNWRPFEYLPSSWYGNNYHRVFLFPGQFGEFSAPRYQATIPTKLRFAMVLADGSQLNLKLW